MRKLITTTLLAVLLGASGLSLSACDDNGDDKAAANKAKQTAPSTATDKSDQDAPGDDASNGGGTGSQNAD